MSSDPQDPRAQRGTFTGDPLLTDAGMGLGEADPLLSHRVAQVKPQSLLSREANLAGGPVSTGSGLTLFRPPGEFRAPSLTMQNNQLRQPN